jgi:hypothetical protein
LHFFQDVVTDVSQALGALAARGKPAPVTADAV